MAPLTWEPHFALGDERLDGEHRYLVEEVAAIQRKAAGDGSPEEVHRHIHDLLDFYKKHAAYEEQTVMADFEAGERLHHRIAHMAHHEAFIGGLTYLKGCVFRRDNRDIVELVVQRAFERTLLELLEFDQDMWTLAKSGAKPEAERGK